MKKPTVSSDGNCPRCASEDWKLARMVVMLGVSKSETESRGGGFGIEVGIGRGKGGAGISYQGVNLESKGVSSTVAAQEYGPPPTPPDYEHSDDWHQQCRNALLAAASAIAKMDQYAATISDDLSPGLFETSSRSKSILQECAKRYNVYREKLASLRPYERDKALWDRTRVCMRCGESFATVKDLLESQALPELPEKFRFEGHRRCCPTCQSYQWKSLDVFHAMQIRNAKLDLVAARQFLREEKTENRENGVRGELVRIDDAIDSRRQAIKSRPDFKSARVCVECKTVYSLQEGAVPKYASQDFSYIGALTQFTLVLYEGSRSVFAAPFPFTASSTPPPPTSGLSDFAPRLGSSCPSEVAAACTVAAKYQQIDGAGLSKVTALHCDAFRPTQYRERYGATPQGSPARERIRAPRVDIPAAPIRTLKGDPGPR